MIPGLSLLKLVIMHKPRFFDIHSHLNFPQFDEDREEIIRKMEEENVWAICVGTGKKTSQECVELAERHKNIYASVGLHPSDIQEGFDMDYYRRLASSAKVVAIGECGIDIKYIKYKKLNIKNDIKNQIEVFEKQIKLAIEMGKPLMVHCRNAHRDAIEILSEFKAENPNLRANIHFFSGTWEEAEKYLDMGFTISFAGPITFSNQYDEIIRRAPLERIMAETDSPFAAPAPFRGRRNEPLYVREIVRKIAFAKGIDFERAREVLVQNALQFLPPSYKI